MWAPFSVAPDNTWRHSTASARSWLYYRLLNGNCVISRELMSSNRHSTESTIRLGCNSSHFALDFNQQQQQCAPFNALVMDSLLGGFGAANPITATISPRNMPVCVQRFNLTQSCICCAVVLRTVIGTTKTFYELDYSTRVRGHTDNGPQLTNNGFLLSIDHNTLSFWFHQVCTLPSRNNDARDVGIVV